jgi:very-short-patch-repair endonuclease
MQSAQKTAVARRLRQQQSWSERLMWSWLRDRRFSAYKFRRQFPMGSYVLDFFCMEALVNIEVDGFQHGFSENRTSDAVRDAWLEKKGVMVLRFWNSRLRRERQAIRDTIWRVLQERAPHPLPDHCRPGVISSCLPRPERS